MESIVPKFPPVKLDPPQGTKEILVHVCCAPCAGWMIESLLYSKIPFRLFFYNPNIHPRREYELRKDCIARYAYKKNIPFVDPGYDPKKWFARVKGLENEPERGKRCTKCFDIRFELAAAYAHENKYSVFTSSCGIARWKDMDQVNGCGLAAADKYPNLTYWTHNWRKNGGSQGMYEVAHKEKFYKQQHCGCIYSLLKANEKRQKNGFPPIRFGTTFYGKKASMPQDNALVESTPAGTAEEKPH